MGFLQQDTNNIILDAVLTNEGRKRLAANDGSFRVVAFSLGDDEERRLKRTRRSLKLLQIAILKAGLA